MKLEAAAPEHQEMNGILVAKWRKVHNTANILLNTARLGGAYFHHAHAYAIFHIINSCSAKNVTDQNGNPSTPFQYSYGRKPSLANFRVFGCPVYFKRYEPTFRNKLITYKQQLQRASRGIFIGFPENSGGWVVYSPDHPQRIIITRDAYFDEDFSSTPAFDSKTFAGAIPIRSHLDPNGLQNSDNSEPSIVHQTGSPANLGITPSTFIEESHDSEQPSQAQDKGTSLLDHDENTTDDTDPITDNDIFLGPTPPMPQLINLTYHQKRHTQLQREMTIYFQECAKSPPYVDPIHTAMLAIDATASSSTDETVDKYLPEPQSFRAVLKLDNDVRNAWLHAIHMEIKNLIDHDTFILEEQPQKHELIIPVKHELIIPVNNANTNRYVNLRSRIHGCMLRLHGYSSHSDATLRYDRPRN